MSICCYNVIDKIFFAFLTVIIYCLPILYVLVFPLHFLRPFRALMTLFLRQNEELCVVKKLILTVVHLNNRQKQVAYFRVSFSQVSMRFYLLNFYMLYCVG